MFRALPHILARVFGPPLLIAPGPLEALLAGLGAAMLHRGSLLEALPDITMAFDKDETPPANERPRGYRISNGVAILPVHGVLMRRAGQVTPDSTPLQSYENVSRVLRTSQRDTRVRATLLDIDSPGGEAGGVFDLADEIRSAAKLKPIWAIANDDALSAAYVLASAADRVYATQTASLGSLGVVALHADQSGLDAKEGLKYTYVYRGAHKIDAHPHGSLTTEAHTAIQGEVDRLYDKLVAMVGEHRSIDPKLIRSQEAQVYFGERAQSQGLVDRIGTLDEAHAALAEHIGRGPRMENETTTQTTTEAKPPAPPPAPPPPASNVVQLARDEGAAAAKAQALEIAELCKLAGHAELAAGFIGEGLGLKAVMQKLQEAQAALAAKSAIVAMNTTASPPSADVMNKLKAAAAARFEAYGRPHPIER